MSVSSAPDFIPVGSVFAFAGLNPPNGYLICDGSEVLVSKYQALYSVIGDIFFSTPTAGHFTLPDLRDNTAKGVNVVTGQQFLPTASGSVTATLASTNIPTLGYSCSVTLATAPVANQDTITTKSATGFQNYTTTGSYKPTGFTSGVGTCGGCDTDLTGLAFSYTGSNTAFTAPVTFTSGTNQLAGIQLTYIIKAFNPLYNSPQPNNTPVTQLPPEISTATNPNLDNPLLSGYIYSQ
jgi:microcystin-dependent protein